MDDIHQRVTACFTNVFPGTPKADIPAASSESLAEWDSMAHIRLLSSIAEEFGIEFEMEDYEDLVSYRKIVNYLESKLQNA